MPKGSLPHMCQHGIATKDCPPCAKARQRAWYAAYVDKRGKEAVAQQRSDGWRDKKQDPEYLERNRERGREYWRALRHEVIMAYGGYVCACCGETEPLFLEIDHVQNDGAAHRRALGYPGNGKGGCSSTLKWIKSNGFPRGFQVLCANCNKGKDRNGGICPHKTNACKHHS